jgi:hypothetical protein
VSAAAPARRRAEALSASLLTLLIATLLAAGWYFGRSGFLTAETGPGYVLGIAGASMMAVMLVYPLRKRIRALKILGPVRYWFQIHMTFGVLAPALIVVHTSFRLGSTNSRVALICMLIVAFSGLAGRFFYRQIHHGLYGHRASLRDLQQQSEQLRETGTTASPLLPDIGTRLAQFEASVDKPGPGGTALTRALRATVASRALRRTLLRDIDAQLRAHAAQSGLPADHGRRLRRTAARHIDRRLRLCRRIAAFTLWERLFSLWHVFHLPLFVLMVIAVFIHIYAVHAY